MVGMSGGALLDPCEKIASGLPRPSPRLAFRYGIGKVSMRWLLRLFCCCRSDDGVHLDLEPWQRKS